MTFRRAGFTMIEMLAVVAILALAATLTGVSLSGAASRASLEDVTQRVIAYDAGARLYASRFDRPVVLAFDERSIAQRFVEEDAAAPPREPLRLPGGYEVRALAPEEGRPTVTVSAGGWSRSYAVRVTAPNGRARSVVFAGLTGEATTVEEEAEAEAMLAALIEPQWLPRDREEAAYVP